jgi:glycosyltransferase involved in cell wall biosynthesis
MDTNPIFEEKTVAIHNYSEKEERKAGKKENYVLYFGRFAKEKGVRILLEATKRLPDISFVFAGSGPLEDEVRTFADKADNVSFVGFKTGDELKKLVSQAMLSVYPSEWYENCPFSVMESINLGTPVLGSDIGGIPELVGYCGLLFKPGDIEDLTNKICSVWSDRESLKKMTDNCSKNDFESLEEYAERFVSLLE